MSAPPAERPWYLDGTFTDRPMRLAALGLNPLQQAAVLEWFAFKIWVAGNEGGGDPDYHSKSYDPLTVELATDGSGVAHSYVFDFHDGGRHHPFDSLDQLEDWLFEEAIGTVAWAVRHGQEGCEEAVARYLFLKEHPGAESAWDGHEWDRREAQPFYVRARKLLGIRLPDPAICDDEDAEPA
jgi:hypothetical protein